MAYKTTPQVFQQTVNKYKNNVALRTKNLGIWHDITWHDYYGNAMAVAGALLSMGLQKGEHVAIVGDNCTQWVYADMGVQCAAGIAVGIYSTCAWQQMEYIVNHSASRFLFVENEEQLDKWQAFRTVAPHLEKIIVWDLYGLNDFHDAKVMTFAELLAMGRNYMHDNLQCMQVRMATLNPADAAVLIYTSGTTGLPKGAILSHKNVTWMAEAIHKAHPVYATDSVLSFLPLCHIFERLFSVFTHITHGYVVNFVERPNTVIENMIEVSPTVGYAVPRIWEKYYSAITIKMSDATYFKRMVFARALRIEKQYVSMKILGADIPAYLQFGHIVANLLVLRKLRQRLGFDRLRIAFSGAAPISKNILIFFQTIGINLIEGYGQTESTGVTTVSQDDISKYGSVGAPLEDVEIRINNDAEILVRGPNIFSGYYKDRVASDAALKNGWLYSGDTGTIDAAGCLTIVGRKKDIIITAGGKNIAPQLIENKLKASIYINDAVIIGDNRKYLTSLIILDEDNIIKYAQDHKIHISTYSNMAQNDAIKALIQENIDKVNGELSRVEYVRKFTILPKKLYVEDGEVTPTMKVKRNYVNTAFKDLIELMY